MLTNFKFIDIDGKFGKLWNYFKVGAIKSPAALRKCLFDCFGKKGLPFEFVEKFVIPNFSQLMANSIDTFEK